LKTFTKKNNWKGFHVTRWGIIVFVVPLVLFIIYGAFKLSNWEIAPALRISLGHYVFVCNMNPPGEIKKGDHIAFRFPLDTPYFKKGDKFIKTVGCMPGDSLIVDNAKNYFCNDAWITTAKDTDVNGNPVVHFVYSGVVPEGEVFVFGTHPRSYDSKYWGFL